MFLRNMCFFLIGATPYVAAGQLLINGDFEDEDGPTLSGWSYNCDSYWSITNPAPNGGSWSLAIEVDNHSDCPLTQFYQLLPQVQDGDPLILSGWARVVHGSPITPAMIGIGALENGNYNVHEWVETSSYEWTFLTLSWTASLEDGAIAFVTLRPGDLPPSGIYSIAGYDGLDLSLGHVGIQEASGPQLQILGRGDHLVLSMDDGSVIQSAMVYDAHGRLLLAKDRTEATAEFNMAGLSAGIYIVKVGTSTSIATYKYFLSR